MLEDASKYRNIRVDYKIGDTIGKGNFATVKKVKHRETGEKFAVKVLYKKKMSEKDKLNIQSEIEILKQLDHPNIVKLVDVFEDEKHWCLVMELMEGGELFEKIIEKERFNEIEAREATKSIIKAIDYCH